MTERKGRATFREMAKALGWEETPEDGDSECGCVYCATGMGGWCSSRPTPLGLLPKAKVGTRIMFRKWDSLKPLS